MTSAASSELTGLPIAQAVSGVATASDLRDKDLKSGHPSESDTIGPYAVPPTSTVAPGSVCTGMVGGRTTAPP